MLEIRAASVVGSREPLFGTSLGDAARSGTTTAVSEGIALSSPAGATAPPGGGVARSEALPLLHSCKASVMSMSIKTTIEDEGRAGGAFAAGPRWSSCRLWSASGSVTS